VTERAKVVSVFLDLFNGMAYIVIPFLVLFGT
jgi:hypothetical protein